MPHDHTSPSGHPYRKDQDGPLTYAQTMEIAVRELLVEKGVTTSLEVQETVEAMDRRSPADGAAVVARAWTDPAFKARLLEDGSAACREMGFDPGAMLLLVVENTDTVHNVIVCTLCSCYPFGVLGMSPAWYKSAAYRARAVREPRAVLAEFDVHLPDEVAVRVWDSTAELRYLVVPQRPKGTEGWDMDRLAGLVTRDSMIGTARDLTPEAL